MNTYQKKYQNLESEIVAAAIKLIKESPQKSAFVNKPCLKLPEHSQYIELLVYDGRLEYIDKHGYRCVINNIEELAEIIDTHLPQPIAIVDTDEFYQAKGIDITEEAKEAVGWEVRDLEDFIDNLYIWISEATKDKTAMIEDLKYLLTLEDDYILSSQSTNKYISPSEDPVQFNLIINQLISYNQ